MADAASDASLADADTEAQADAAPDSDASPPPPPPPTYYGVSFDRGSLERVEAPYQAGMAGAAALTVEGWFLLRQPTDEGHLFQFHGGNCSYAGSAGYGVMQGHLNCLVKLNGGGVTAQVFSQQLLTLGKWFHVAFVLRNGVWTLFLNGQTQGTAVADYGPTLPGVIPFEARKFKVGGTGTAANETIDGVVDEFRASLSADYVADFVPPAHLAAAGSPSLALDEGAGLVVGAGSGSLVGGSSWTTVVR